MMRYWLASSDNPVDETFAAIHQWKMIRDKPTTIVVVRERAELNEQIVRIERYSIAREDTYENMTGTVQRAIVFGVKNHPDITVLDTDLQRSDRFRVENSIFEVVEIIVTSGAIQAVCEVRA